MQPRDSSDGIPADARLTEVRLRFSESGSLENWTAFAKSVGLEPTAMGDGDDTWFAASSVALPSDSEPYLLSIDLTWFAGTFACSFLVGEAPPGAPPPSLRKASERLGGYPAVLRELDVHWPISRSLKLVEASARFVVESDRWKTLPAVRARSFHGLRVFPEVVVWRVAEQHRLQSIFQHHHPPSDFEIGGEAELALEFSASMFDAAAREIWSLITTW